MASIFADAGSAATYGLELWTSTGGFNGAASSDTQAILGSVRSIKCTQTQNQGSSNVTKNSILADAGRRFSFGYRTTALPSTYNSIVRVRDASSTAFLVGVNSSGNLFIQNKWSSGVATGATVLTTNTDYRISVAYTITNGSTNTVTVYLNGVQEVTASNLTVDTGKTNLLLGRNLTLETCGTGTDYFAHVYVDDGTTGDIGNIRVTAKRPASNGTNNNFSTQIGAGGSGYGSGHSPQVNERALSTTNGWSMVGAGSAVTEEYTIEGQSAGDVDITGATFVDFIGWVYAASTGTETGSIKALGSTSNISLTTTNTMFTKIAGSTTYPAGGTDIGIVTSTDLNTVSLFEAGILVVYTPAVSFKPRSMLMGAG